VKRRLAAALLVTATAPAVVLFPTAARSDTCVLTPVGIECSAGGSSTSLVPGDPPPGESPPLRYLVVAGDCWYWSAYPPGYDSWDPAFDHLIITTRFRLRACTGDDPGPPPMTGDEVVSRAWEVFRAFPLDPPALRLQPEKGGITGLPTFLSVVPPVAVGHREALPDGTVLEVRARATSLVVDWGDGTPVAAFRPEQAIPHPGGSATHTYALKTCAAAYRRFHPSGGNCHPSLEEYRVVASFVWTASYRRGGPWSDLGTLERSSTAPYDVDEVVGYLYP
jgi:hypothetical protein